uniref:Egg protein n=1 Tax=Schistosoma japonicum TaxID=6182 RepID=Q5DD41_SCHJA|nr:unknown [Schistosoma japonicum]
MKIALALLFILQLHSIQLQLISGSKVSADSNSRSKGNNIETKNNGKSMSNKKHLENNRMLTKYEKKIRKEFNQNLKRIETMVKNMTIVLTTMTKLIKDVPRKNLTIEIIELFENKLPLLNYIRDRLETAWNETHTLERSLNPLIEVKST